MSNQDEMIDLIKAISGQANILTIPRVYVSFTKSHRAAMFLSQSVYWSDRTDNTDGWFYKSFKDWKRELGLNQHAVSTCVKVLMSGGWIETKLDKVGIRDTTFYRPILSKIAESIQSTLAGSANVETANVPKRKTIRSSIKQKLHTKTTPERRGKPRDPLLDHPAVVAYRDAAHLTPNELQRTEIVARVGDNGQIDRWKEVLKTYIISGKNPRNVSYALDIFEGKTNNGNGAKRDTTQAHINQSESVSEDLMQKGARINAQRNGTSYEYELKRLQVKFAAA